MSESFNISGKSLSFEDSLTEFQTKQISLSFSILIGASPADALFQNKFFTTFLTVDSET